MTLIDVVSLAGLVTGAGFFLAGTATGRAARLWIMAGLLLPALIVAALPWSSGALAKLMLKDALAALPPP